jgi:hypothetical protein
VHLLLLLHLLQLNPTLLDTDHQMLRSYLIYLHKLVPVLTGLHHLYSKSYCNED